MNAEEGDDMMHVVIPIEDPFIPRDVARGVTSLQLHVLVALMAMTRCGGGNPSAQQVADWLAWSEDRVPEIEQAMLELMQAGLVVVERIG